MFRLIVKRSSPIAAIVAFSAFQGKKAAQSTTNNNRKPLYFWGSNVYGLASPDASTNSIMLKQPHQCFFWADQGLNIIAICASERHAACIDSNGDLWQWGEDVHTTFNKPIKRIKNQNFTGITCNDQMIFALNRKGQVVAMPVDPSQSPQQVECEEALTAIASGHDHLLGVSTTGKLHTAAINTCGNAYGQLGIGIIEQSQATLKPSKKSLTTVIFDWPRETSTASDLQSSNDFDMERQIYDTITFQPVHIKEKVTDIAAGAHHSLVLGESGMVYVFGSNSNLQLGLGRNAPTMCALPTPISTTLPPITQVAAAGNTSFFLSNQPEKSTLYSAGNGLYGQLGIGGYHHAIGEPSLISTVSNQFYYDEVTKRKLPIAIKGLWSGPNNAAVLMDTFHANSQEYNNSRIGYDLLAWGSNKNFQLSATSHANIPTPATIRPPSPSSPAVDFTDLALSVQGPTTVNPEQTISFLGGQLQVLPDESGKPNHRLFIAPEFSCIY